jgi:hypothetical protein
VREFLGHQDKRLEGFDAGAADDMRQDFRDAGYDWPEWCYLPGTAWAAALADQAGLTGRGFPPADLLNVSMAMALVAAWLPGRIAVHYDPDIASELVGTPLEGHLPIQLLERLPAWGLYLDCPHLGPGAGVLACLEPAEMRGPPGAQLSDAKGGTELWLAFSDPAAPGSSLVLTSVWVGSGSLSDALTDQDRQGPTPASRLEGDQAELERAFGRPYRDIVRGVVALLLYLCAGETDLVRRTVATPGRGRQGDGAGDITVLRAGFRLGAAPRAASRARNEDTAAGGDSRRLRPHLRAAHFHSYWVGPRSDPEARRLELRWLPPVAVNVDQGAEAAVVVRPVRD